MPVRKFKDFPKAFKNFSQEVNPNGIRRVLFLKSEWEDFLRNRGVTFGYLAYRAIYMLYFIIAVTFASTCSKESTKLFNIYFTNWVAVTQAIYGTLYFANVLYYYIKQKVQKDDKEVAMLDHFLPTQLNIVEKLIWVLQSSVFVCPLIVSIIYWIVLFPLPQVIVVNDTLLFKNCELTTNVMVHAGNSIFALFDLMVNALPVHVTHFVYLALYALIYTAFTGFYELAGGKYHGTKEYIYPILNWRRTPGWTILYCFMIVILAAILHITLWCIYILRLIIVSKVFKVDVYAYHHYAYDTSTPNTPVAIPSGTRTAIVDVGIENETISADDVNTNLKNNMDKI